MSPITLILLERHTLTSEDLRWLCRGEVVERVRLRESRRFPAADPLRINHTTEVSTIVALRDLGHPLPVFQKQ